MRDPDRCTKTHATVQVVVEEIEGADWKRREGKTREELLLES